MTLAPGAELSRYTVAARALPLAVVLRLGERIAGALAHAHGRGVVHRDLKPANVRVDWPTSQLTVLDFGLARSADSAATRTGLVPGSPVYMAPELLAGAMPSPATDLYALGATLFHLLTMRPPHDAPTLGALLQSVAAAPAPALHTLRPDAPPALAELVAALLARQAHDRPARAATVAERLRDASEKLATAPAAEGPMSHR
jgi:eukaryotic-like serine/threonine-protein kinase